MTPNDQEVEGPPAHQRPDTAPLLIRAAEVGPVALHRYCASSQEGMAAVGSAFILIVRGDLGESPSLSECTTYAQAIAQTVSNDRSGDALVAEALIRATYGEVRLLRNIPADQLVRIIADYVYSIIVDKSPEEAGQFVAEVDNYVSVIGDRVASIVATALDEP